MSNNVTTLDDIFKSCSELFKAYLTNPIFKNNMDLLMKIPIQEKDLQNAIQIMKMVEDKYNYELTDESSDRPWKPKILDDMSTINLLSPPPTVVIAVLVMVNLSWLWVEVYNFKNIMNNYQKNCV